MGQEIDFESKPSSKTLGKTEESPVKVVEFPDERLPKPEPPPGINADVGKLSPPAKEKATVTENGFPAIGKYFRTVLSRRKSGDGDSNGGGVTEFNMSGVTVVVRRKEEIEENGSFEGLGLLKGRVTIYSRSNCRDCGAVRKILREKGLKFTEINLDVYPARENELVDRTGGSTVPQIFFNEKLIGGLVAVNSLRNSGLLDRTAKDLLGRKCPDDAPGPPVYGFDEPEEEQMDEMAGVVKILRLRLPIQDRLVRMRIIKNCFTGKELVDVLVHHLGCPRNEAIEVGKEIVRKHFIHQVFGGTNFEDGTELYRFLEHEQFIPKCFNFRGSTDDREPESPVVIGQKLMKIMSAILESYASEDRLHVDYLAISNSEEFRRYLNVVEGLQRVDILLLSTDEKLAFFLNLYNAMVIHAVIRKGFPDGMMDRKSFVTEFQYLVGGNSYSLNAIKNGILRNNRRAPYALVKPFSAGDSRLQMAFPTVNPLIHFGLCDGTKSSPSVRFFTLQNVQAELKSAAREFFTNSTVKVDLMKRTVNLPCILKWYKADFGNEKEFTKWVMNYLDAQVTSLLTHLLSDGDFVSILYQNYDWSINS
ncbi:uncharacterized protein LOC141643664 [Silene latifolia]|uniref:uncharacterized protein LOC141643664 n=1 Tax=Silene latifolia TaxID=37657 RepID=UPI003D76F928